MRPRLHSNSNPAVTTTSSHMLIDGLVTGLAETGCDDRVLEMSCDAYLAVVVVVWKGVGLALPWCCAAQPVESTGIYWK